MKKTIAILLTIMMLLSLSAAAFAEEAKAPLIIAEQGYFSAGGTGVFFGRRYRYGAGRRRV